MSNDASASQEETKRRKKRRLIFWGISLTIIVPLLYQILYLSLNPIHPARPTTKCKNHLKQIGMQLQAYFSEQPNLRFSAAFQGKLDAASAAAWDCDANLLTCPENHKKAQPSGYEWNPKLIGKTFAECNDTNFPILCDAVPHCRRDNPLDFKPASYFYLVLYGDGHIDYSPVKPW